MAGGASKKTPKRDRHLFAVGSTVEVLTEEQDYGGVFFTATVVESTASSSHKGGKKNSKSKKLRVQYHDLVVEEGGSERLREYVDVSVVRPVPPACQERVGGCFEVGQLVDAFYNDGWWTGVVTQLVDGGGRENRRVIVTFPHPPDVREFAASELRSHLKWVDGTWITPEKQDVTVLSSIGVHLHDQSLKFSESMKLNLMNNQSEESAPVNRKTSHVASNITKRRHSSEPRASSPPVKRLKEGGLFGARQQVQIDRMLKEMVSDIRTEYQLSNNLSPWNPVTKKRSNIGAAQTVGGKTDHACENVEKIVHPLNLEVVIGGKNCPSQVVENKLARNVSRQPVIVGLPVTDTDNFESGKSMIEKACVSGSILANNLSGDSGTQFNDSTTQKKDGRSLGTCSMNLRRKGKPRKYVFSSVQSPMNGYSQSGDPNPKSTDNDVAPCSVSEKVVTVIDDVPPNQEKMALDGDKFAKDQPGPAYKRRQATEKSPAETHDENSDEETLLAAMRRRRTNKSRKISPEVHDHPKASGENTSTKKCDATADTVVTGAPGLKFCDGPLLQCTREMSSIECLNLGTPKDRCMENEKDPRDDELLLEDKLENQHQPSASANKASFKPNDEAALPFVKNNDLWKTIESMEAFKKIPQKPHFRPLENFPERSRQGLAIGLMVTCSSVMEEALNLRLSDPKSITDSILEMLADLETHGFDVKTVKDRVNNFIAVKDKQHYKLEEVKRLNDQILESEGKKRTNIEEVCKIKEQIQTLQERLMLIEYADAKAGEEIACLKAKLQETVGEIDDAGRDFEASNSW